MNKDASLRPSQKKILKEKGTEAPYTGVYNETVAAGTYLCRGCGLGLFRATSQFTSGCGWPSFDDGISGNILQRPDADGRRTEILCARCHGHLGHVFRGEGFTQKNTRHCVNSLAIDFVENQTVEDSEEAIVAAGCFWGVEYFFKMLNGVLKTEVGYTGGHTSQPTYQDVCQKNTGHLEALRVVYDPKVISYQEIIHYFFEIHNPEQTNGQGPDIGSQYLSAIFYFNDEQQRIVRDVINLLQGKGLKIATKMLATSVFWPAEEGHQNYYDKTGEVPYCHVRTKRL